MGFCSNYGWWVFLYLYSTQFSDETRRKNIPAIFAVVTFYLERILWIKSGSFAHARDGSDSTAQVASRLVVLVVSVSIGRRQLTGRCRFPRTRDPRGAPSYSVMISVSFLVVPFLSNSDP